MADKKTKAPAPTTANASVESTQITLQDLQGFANIIDLSSRRGAFHASEMETVGKAYNKLASFLAQVAASQKEEAASVSDVVEG